jgi:hypothetical protein
MSVCLGCVVSAGAFGGVWLAGKAIELQARWRQRANMARAEAALDAERALNAGRAFATEPALGAATESSLARADGGQSPGFPLSAGAELCASEGHSNPR